MPIQLNTDSFEIRNYELTPQGYLKLWLIGGVPDRQLIYDDNRKEVIAESELFNEDSINSAVGKPITLNHPPRAITAKNYKQYSHGTILQEYAKEQETGALVLAGIVHDADVVEGIMKGEYRYVSAGYTANKSPNQDGVLSQSNRHYDHFAALTNEYTPRAGQTSRILVQSTSPEPESETPPTTMDATASTANDVTERVELLSTWRSKLEAANRTIDYNWDAKTIKRQVLSIFYPERTIKQITDGNIDGVWVGFLMNNDAQQQTNQQQQSNAETNFDSALAEAIAKFTQKMEGRTHAS